MRAIGFYLRAALAGAACVLLSVMAQQWAQQGRIEPERFARDTRVLLQTVHGFFARFAALRREAAAQPGRSSSTVEVDALAGTNSSPGLALPNVVSSGTGIVTKPDVQSTASSHEEPDFAMMLRKARENRELLGKGSVR